MASAPETRGFGERVVDSARYLGSGMVSSGVGLETELRDLTLRCGKLPSVRASQSCENPRVRDSLRGEANMRSLAQTGATSEEFERFVTADEIYPGLDQDGKNALAGYGIHKFLVPDPPSPLALQDRSDMETSWRNARPHSQSHQQCASSSTSSSTHALPTELRSLALERLRQIESHIASSTSTSNSSSAAAEAQRRSDLENEWLFWWDESPTACFDDSRGYFADEAQRTYTEAWEKHIQHADRLHTSIQTSHVANRLVGATQSVPVHSIQRQSSYGEEASPRCPNRRSHEDLTACGRSTPIAAQHRPCPHPGCGYCSTSSAGWYEHMRACIA